MKIEPTAQGIALGMIVATLCLAFLAALGLGSPLGVKLEPNASAATITLFVGLVSAATGWFFGQRTEQAKSGVEVSTLRTENEALTQEKKVLQGRISGLTASIQAKAQEGR